MVSIAAFQAVDPGSIPGRRIDLCVLVNQPFLKFHRVYYVQFCLSLTVVFSFFTCSLMKDSSLILVILVFCDWTENFMWLPKLCICSFLV